MAPSYIVKENEVVLPNFSFQFSEIACWPHEAALTGCATVIIAADCIPEASWAPLVVFEE
jgi:hypothetical protein